jgi:hypothetical protein
MSRREPNCGKSLTTSWRKEPRTKLLNEILRKSASNQGFSKCQSSDLQRCTFNAAPSPGSDYTRGPSSTILRGGQLWAGFSHFLSYLPFNYLLVCCLRFVDSTDRFRLWFSTANLRLISLLLAYSAFAVSLFSVSVEGLLVAIVLSSASLLLYLYVLSPSKHILHVKLHREDLFFACVGVTLFIFLNVASKILFPYAMSSYSNAGFAIFELLLAVVLGYGLILYMGHLVQHNDFLNEPATFSNDRRLRDQYERVGNAIIIAAIFLALDSPNVMLLTSVVLLSSRFLIQGISRVLMVASDLLPSFGSRASIRSRTHRLSLFVMKADLEDALWRRVLYVSRYKRGLAYMLLALMNGLPSIIYSYNLNFSHLQLGPLTIFLLLSVPSITTVYALKFPRGVVATAKEAGHLRKVLILASMAVPIATIPLIYFEPSFLGFNGAYHSALDVDIVGSFVAFAWMAVFPLFVGFPLYSMIAAAELDDFRGFVAKARLFAASPGLVVAPTSIALMWSLKASFPISLVLLTLHLGITCYFYAFMILASIQILRNFEQRSGKVMDQWIRKIRGPFWSVCLLDMLLGAIFFPLIVLTVPVLHNWFRMYNGIVIPGIEVALVWIVGGLIVSLLTFPLLEHNTILSSIRAGLVGSLGVLAFAMAFLGVFEDPSFIQVWAVWILAIPTGFALGAMISQPVNSLFAHRIY